MATLIELHADIEKYIKNGYHKDVAKATRVAQRATRYFIYSTHAHTAFGGKTLSSGQFRIGTYKVEPDRIRVNIYANYFARWYNTGAYGNIIKKSGPRQGEKGPVYPARGNYFESNKAAIEAHFKNCLEEYLKRNISL